MVNVVFVTIAFICAQRRDKPPVWALFRFIGYGCKHLLRATQGETSLPNFCVLLLLEAEQLKIIPIKTNKRTPKSISSV